MLDVRSVGGIETCIQVPGWKLAIDLGRCPRGAVRWPTVLFTHGHVDHLGGVAWHAGMRDLQGMPAPTYYVPRENLDDLEELFTVWGRLNGAPIPHRLEGAAPGERLELNKRLVVDCLRAVHRVPTLAYVISSRSKAVKPEYRGLPSERIRSLRVEEGREVEDERITPELAYTGDTRIELIEREPLLRTVKRLVIESTFLDDRVSVKDARRRGHIHLEEIAERAELFENEALLLMHYSARHRTSEPGEARELRARIREVLPASLAARTYTLTESSSGPVSS